MARDARAEHRFSRRESQDDAKRADQGLRRLDAARDGSGCASRLRVASTVRAQLRHPEFLALGWKSDPRPYDDHHGHQRDAPHSPKKIRDKRYTTEGPQAPSPKVVIDILLFDGTKLPPRYLCGQRQPSKRLPPSEQRSQTRGHVIHMTRASLTPGPGDQSTLFFSDTNSEVVPVNV